MSKAVTIPVSVSSVLVGVAQPAPRGGSVIAGVVVAVLDVVEVVVLTGVDDVVTVVDGVVVATGLVFTTLVESKANAVSDVPILDETVFQLVMVWQ